MVSKLVNIWLFSSVMMFAQVVSAQDCQDDITRSAPDSRYVIDGGTVLDSRTQLVWQRCAAGLTLSSDGTLCDGRAGGYSWSEALALADGTWRLPNIKELASLVEVACTDPSLNNSVFPNASEELYDSYFWSTYFWSSSTYVEYESGTYAWVVYFKDGYDQYTRKNRDTLRVRLVRDL